MRRGTERGAPSRRKGAPRCAAVLRRGLSPGRTPPRCPSTRPSGCRWGTGASPRGVLPLLLAAVRQEVDEREGVAQLLGAAAFGVPGAIDGVAVAQEHVDGEAAAGRGADIRPERAVGRRVPRHPVADPLLVGERLVDGALGDDDEAGVVLVEELQAGVLRGEPRAAGALPLLPGEPHVVVDDQLPLALEDVREPDGAVGALQRVLRHLDHRQPAALGGDGVELPRRGLLPRPQGLQPVLPGRAVDDGGSALMVPSQNSYATFPCAEADCARGGNSSAAYGRCPPAPRRRRLPVRRIHRGGRCV